jgi:hypothetical protein
MSSTADEPPVSVWSGSFWVFGVEVKCHRLANGQNIIEAESFNNLLAAMMNGNGDPGDLAGFNAWRKRNRG